MKNRIWLFGMDPMEIDDFLRRLWLARNWALDYEEPAARYGKPTGRMLASTPVERSVYAEKL